jgi:hydroxymethylglutaryl-CoA reductase
MTETKPPARAKFYSLSITERLQQLADSGCLDAAELAALSGQAGLTPSQADHMIENVIGTFALPLGIAQHFVINGREVLVPMVIEEPSVVAAASYMARLASAGGGFIASCTSPEMIGQMQILDVRDLAGAVLNLKSAKEKLISAAKVDPMLQKLGGGPRDLEVRVINDSPIGPFLVLHLIMDVRDAMGANAINTALEALTPLVQQFTGGRVLLRILSNLADRRLAKASCRIPLSELAFKEFSAEQVRDGIIAAWAFATVDPYRAATHNKGIMNGVDAVLLATGNDWRAVEAGAHAYAARDGRYASLSRWSTADNGDLLGELEMPMALGIVGGATRVHPGARAALKLMGVKFASDLAEIVVSVGLAQNLGALRALATEGIQRGHMNLHARQVAVAAGAPEDMVDPLAQQLINENNIRIERALEILQSWSQK